MDWDLHAAELERLTNLGLPTAAVAAALSKATGERVTRCAVIGAAHRRGIRLNGHAQRREPLKKPGRIMFLLKIGAPL